MTVEIKPMSIGGIFDRTFKLIGKTMTRNLIIASVLLLPVSIIFAYGLQQFFAALAMVIRDSSYENIQSIRDLSPLFSAIAIFSVALLLFSLLELLAKIAAMHVAGCELHVQPISWSDAIRIAFKNKLLTALGQAILQGIAIGALFLIPYILLIACIVAKSIPLMLVCILIFFAGVAAAIYFTISWLFTLPVIAVEDVGVIESFRRSRSLVRSHWWRTLGIYLLLSIVASLAISMITTPITFIAMWGFISKYISFFVSYSSHHQNPEYIFELLSTIGWIEGIVIAISAILELVVTPIIFVVMYFDLRARKGEFGPVEQGPEVPYNLVPPAL